MPGTDILVLHAESTIELVVPGMVDVAVEANVDGVEVDELVDVVV